MSNIVYVAFLDILGFKDLVERNTHEELENIYSQFFNSVKENGELFEALSKILKGQKGFNTTVQSIIISDSIVLWTKDDDINNFNMLVLAVRLLIMKSFGIGIPLRGAITRGPLSVSIENSIQIFGKSLTNAYTTESHMEISGCVIEDECMEYVLGICDGNEIFNNITNSNCIIQYLMPKKYGEVKNHYMINWVSPAPGSYILESFSKHNKSINNWAVHNKIKNTSDFIDYIKMNNLEVIFKNN